MSIDTHTEIRDTERAAMMAHIGDLITGKARPQTPNGMHITGVTIEPRGIGVDMDLKNDRLYYAIGVSQITDGTADYQPLILGIPADGSLSVDTISIGWGRDNVLSRQTTSSLQNAAALLEAAFANVQPADEPVRLDRVAYFHVQPQNERRAEALNVTQLDGLDALMAKLPVFQLALSPESPLTAVTARWQKAMQEQ